MDGIGIMKSNKQILEVWGDFACFTRPEMKVERFSYPIITPSAARGIFDAIYWKPGFYWQIEKIEVLKPIKFIPLRRNEVIKKAGGKIATIEPIFADEKRTQRQTIALKDVKYRITAFPEVLPDKQENLPIILSQFRRRAERGQCFVQPVFGCREFPAFFRLIPDDEVLTPPLPINQELSFMVYDVFPLDVFNYPVTKDDTSQASLSVFNATLKNGVLEVPHYKSELVKKGEKHA
jgi:CRISPR-associated protein Cas5d